MPPEPGESLVPPPFHQGHRGGLGTCPGSPPPGPRALTDLVSVPHARQREQQVGGQHGGDALERHHGRGRAGAGPDGPGRALKNWGRSDGLGRGWEWGLGGGIEPRGRVIPSWTLGCGQDHGGALRKAQRHGSCGKFGNQSVWEGRQSHSKYLEKHICVLLASATAQTLQPSWGGRDGRGEG